MTNESLTVPFRCRRRRAFSRGCRWPVQGLTGTETCQWKTSSGVAASTGCCQTAASTPHSVLHHHHHHHHHYHLSFEAVIRVNKLSASSSSLFVLYTFQKSTVGDKWQRFLRARWMLFLSSNKQCESDDGNSNRFTWQICIFSLNWTNRKSVTLSVVHRNTPRTPKCRLPGWFSH